MRQIDHENFQTEEISETNNTFKELISFLRDLVIIFIIVIIIRSFVITPFRINGSSMESSYHDKEYIIVDKFSYLNFPVTYTTNTGTSAWNQLSEKILGSLPVHVGDPKRGDVVVITPHVDRQREYYIKRVIGLPGDAIKFEDGEVFIKTTNSSTFVKIDESSYLSIANRGQTRLPDNVKSNEFVIPAGYYWVMGDNRNNSADSRSCFKNCIGSIEISHFIKRKDIIGKVLLNLGYYNIFGEGGLLENQKWTWTHPPRFLAHPKNASYPELGENQ